MDKSFVKNRHQQLKLSYLCYKYQSDYLISFMWNALYLCTKSMAPANGEIVFAEIKLKKNASTRP